MPYRGRIIDDAILVTNNPRPEEERMSNKEQERTGGTLSGEDMDTSSVLEGAEPWDPVETKLVVGSLICAGIALIIGLILVPTSIFH